MMDDSAREGNLLKGTKICSFENKLWLLRYVGRSIEKKNEKEMEKKKGHRRKRKKDILQICK